MAHDLVLAGARLLTGDSSPDARHADGWLAVDAGRVAAWGHGSAPDAVRREELDGDWLAPGFVDLHVHGGGGGDLMSPDPASRDAVRRFHARHGTAALLASTVSRPAEELRDAVARLAADAGDPPPSRHMTTRRAGLARVLGIHLEGPFLSPVRRGAHEESALRAPDRSELDALLEAGRGHVRSMTIAPELPGALELVTRLAALGVVAAVGHTDADADTVRAAVAAGARAVTHTYNAMRPLHHRDPGAVGAALDLPELTCELVLDLVHVDPVAARVLVRAAGAGRVCLVTDAIAAAGMGDGPYRLGGEDVEVVDGAARLPGTDTLAGSTLTMAAAVANAVEHLRVDVPTAVAMATTVPASLLPGVDAGRIRQGGPADLVRLDARARLAGVWLSGRPVPDVP